MDRVTLGQKEFDYPLLMLAAGMCKTLDTEAVTKAVQGSDIGVVGSITPQKRGGNTGKCEDFDDELYGLNSWGMPNEGVESAEYVDNTFGPLYNYKTPIVVSVAGFSVADYVLMYRKLLLWGAGVELNFGCPNVRDDGSQHKIASFDPQYLHSILEGIAEMVVIREALVGIKLSPYSDPGMLKEIAAVIAEFHRYIDYVATCNTFPNGVGIDGSGGTRIFTDNTGIYGGISGEALKPISLGNAAQLREALPDKFAIIRVGGVSTGRDVWESYEVGCHGVQIGTAYAKEGPNVFNRIREELVEIHERLD